MHADACVRVCVVHCNAVRVLFAFVWLACVVMVLPCACVCGMHLFCRETMKESKTAVTTTGDDGARDRILLGVPGQKFKFETDASLVTFAPCSVRGDKLDAVREFVRAARP